MNSRLYLYGMMLAVLSLSGCGGKSLVDILQNPTEAQGVILEAPPLVIPPNFWARPLPEPTASQKIKAPSASSSRGVASPNNKKRAVRRRTPKKTPQKTPQNDGGFVPLPTPYFEDDEEEQLQRQRPITKERRPLGLGNKPLPTLDDAP